MSRGWRSVGVDLDTSRLQSLGWVELIEHLGLYEDTQGECALDLVQRPVVLRNTINICLLMSHGC